MMTLQHPFVCVFSMSTAPMPIGAVFFCATIILARYLKPVQSSRPKRRDDFFCKKIPHLRGIYVNPKSEFGLAELNPKQILISKFQIFLFFGWLISFFLDLGFGFGFGLFRFRRIDFLFGSFNFLFGRYRSNFLFCG